MIATWHWLKMNMRSNGFTAPQPLSVAAAAVFWLAVTALPNAYAAKVFMLGGSVAQENTEI